jgi:RNA polymerase sigma factor (sigma-70 family)
MTRFQTTRWSLIEAAGGGRAESRPALEALCRAYRPPVLAYVRGTGIAHGDAEDLTQEFFVHFLEHDVYRRAGRGRGRFRVLLLASLRNFLIDRHARAMAAKRGGGRHAEALDPATLVDPGEGPERAFSRLWLQAVLDQALDRLQGEWSRAGKQERYALLAPLLLEHGDGAGLQEAAARTGERPNTLAVQCWRMRRRLRQLVRLELMRTVSNRETLEQELAELRGTLDPAS